MEYTYSANTHLKEGSETQMTFKLFAIIMITQNLIFVMFRRVAELRN